MRDPYVPPEFGVTAFNCPLCGALAHQEWFSVQAVASREPGLLGQAQILAAMLMEDQPLNVRQKSVEELTIIEGGQVRLRSAPKQTSHTVENIHISRCFNCKSASIWKRDALLHPQTRSPFQPNPDMLPEIQSDFDEAARVLDISPRSAGALLRLCLQKLCLQLGLTGDINKDIGTLVSRGLDPRVQKSLDLLRVLGNEAVHPGTIDLRDDRTTVSTLFRIINRIAFDLITHPKEVDELYANLPDTKLAQIEKRDEKRSS